jgi:hypothetical protein
MTDDRMCEAVVAGLTQWQPGDKAIIVHGSSTFGLVTLVRKVPPAPDQRTSTKIWYVKYDHEGTGHGVVYESDLRPR